MATARTLQADIEQSRKLASDIVKQAEADEERLRILAEHEAQVKFLEKEHFFNSQLVETVHSIKQISEILDEVESLARDGQIMQPLHILEGMAINVGYGCFISNTSRILGDFS
jgi:centromere/kinetochore protein ZW10